MYQCSKRSFTMKLLALCFALSLHAQSIAPPNTIAAGASYLTSGPSRLAGTGLLTFGSSTTQAFAVLDAVPTTKAPITVTSNLGLGIAQRVFGIGRVSFWIPTAAGVSWTGKSVGWAWDSGALASIQTNSSWRIMPNVRFLKSSISNSNYQLIAGVLIGWGW
jgi:hypothetical protein